MSVNVLHCTEANVRMPALLNKGHFLIVFIFLPNDSLLLQPALVKLKLAHSLFFYSSADIPFLGMAESQHIMSKSKACVIKHSQTPVPNDVEHDVIYSKLFQMF